VQELTTFKQIELPQPQEKPVVDAVVDQPKRPMPPQRPPPPPRPQPPVTAEQPEKPVVPTPGKNVKYNIAGQIYEIPADPRHYSAMLEEFHKANKVFRGLTIVPTGETWNVFFY
jgi:hypothetical protein